MKSSSILIPVVLIVCLLALALLISQVFVTSEDREAVSQDSVNPTVSANLAEEEEAMRREEAALLARQTPEAPEELVPRSSPNIDGATHKDGYFVIAGTFRQVINARTRVKELQRAGFSSTEMSKFDRGTYAVALVGRSEEYDEAAELAERVRAAGFEAKVYEKR